MCPHKRRLQEDPRIGQPDRPRLGSEARSPTFVTERGRLDRLRPASMLASSNQSNLSNLYLHKHIEASASLIRTRENRLDRLDGPHSR